MNEPADVAVVIVNHNTGDYLGRFARRGMAYSYTVRDATGTLALQVNKGSGANRADQT